MSNRGWMQAQYTDHESESWYWHPAWVSDWEDEDICYTQMLAIRAAAVHDIMSQARFRMGVWDEALARNIYCLWALSFDAVMARRVKTGMIYLNLKEPIEGHPYQQTIEYLVSEKYASEEEYALPNGEEVRHAFLYSDYVDKAQLRRPDVTKRRSLRSSTRYEVIQRDGGACVLCGRTAADGVKLEVDHIIPVSKGGSHHHQNLRTLCKECNIGKGTKLEGGK